MIRRTGVLVCSAAAVLAVAAPAAAAPAARVGNPEAACLGIAASEHGANDPAGTWAGDVAGIRAFVGSSGYSSGDVLSRWARVDAATHDACEDAFLQLDLAAPR